MFIKKLLLACFFLNLSGCMSFKPFQPNPPEYMSWIKTGAGEEDVKQTMRSCGYKNLYGYGGPVVSEEEIAMMENCMFNKGFHRSGRYKGICSLKSDPPIAACKDYVRP